MCAVAVILIVVKAALWTVLVYYKGRDGIGATGRRLVPGDTGHTRILDRIS
jgi:hypothetical protein